MIEVDGTDGQTIRVGNAPQTGVVYLEIEAEGTGPIYLEGSEAAALGAGLIAAVARVSVIEDLFDHANDSNLHQE